MDISGHARHHHGEGLDPRLAGLLGQPSQLSTLVSTLNSATTQVSALQASVPTQVQNFAYNYGRWYAAMLNWANGLSAAAYTGMTVAQSAAPGSQYATQAQAAYAQIAPVMAQWQQLFGYAAAHGSFPNGVTIGIQAQPWPLIPDTGAAFKANPAFLTLVITCLTDGANAIAMLQRQQPISQGAGAGGFTPQGVPGSGASTTPPGLSLRPGLHRAGLEGLGDPPHDGAPMQGDVYQYAGSLGEPLPPLPEGFELVPYEDGIAQARSTAIARASARLEAGAPATLGDPPDSDALDSWQFRDELHPGGLYRFFIYEHAAGRAVGAARFTGALGEPSTIGDLTDATLQSAAAALVQYLQGKGCTASAFTECGTFQTAFNAQAPAASLPTIATDQQYGPCTQQALQAVLNAAPAAGGGGPTQQAPTSCIAGTCASGQFVAPASSTSTPATGVTSAQAGTALATTTAAAAPSSSSGVLWFVLGGLVLAGAAVAGIASSGKF